MAVHKLRQQLGEKRGTEKFDSFWQGEEDQESLTSNKCLQSK